MPRTRGGRATQNDEEAPRDEIGDRNIGGRKPREEPPIACPFFRSDPENHWDCRETQLKGIGDLRTHILKRRHKEPEIVCPRCWERFSGKNKHQAQQDHIRGCKKLKPRPTTWLTKEQAEAVEKKGETEDPGNAEVRKWYYIWDVLFPHAPRPSQGPHYDGTPLEERVVMRLQTFQERGYIQQMTNKLVISLGPNADRNRVSNLLHSLLQDFSAHVVMDEQLQRDMSQAAASPIIGPQPLFGSSYDDQFQDASSSSHANVGWQPYNVGGYNWAYEDQPYQP
ncbi:hypothetical protein B0T22DRAFT_481444 [Podospora appendiculata]|uniref:C2H2-type domain-containing protein n=1 Tax=Podospora appendiculata TaxID=314037 RepID=A0AAE0XCS9_9PEZI|nr:hypothetical protein B0T22DRAFT_481444 [Podospora appendiculata]